ncbi:hypothetical protein ACPYO6_07195 [Georgenia sp. Z1344]|uniref:hypothetical protein n=1 Tax=Georgenia sp. Z1344 TaxID=3416706 RepID=UPI003CE6B623
MTPKYGQHHDDVQAFLDEVVATPSETWVGLMAGDTTVQERPAAVKAIVGGLPAAVRGAVSSAALAAISEVGLTDEHLTGRRRRQLHDRVETAAVAIARGDDLAPEHREVLLRPFVTSGFTSVTGR